LRKTGQVIALAALALALSRSAAIGQTVQPRLSVAAGGGIANPLHADFDFTAPDWHVSVRAANTRHLAIEGFYEVWEHAEGRIEQVTTHRMRTAGLNLVATVGSPRVMVSGGGGISLIAYDRRYTIMASGCDAGVANVCENRFSSDSFAFQGLAEVDVAVVRRVQAFGRYQLVAAFTDPGFGYANLSAGVRIVLF
jgi:hypothetical protein